jgi:hypothetical protein
VTITDSRGIKHSVEVTAESLFEAGVLAIGTLRKAGWIEESPGPGTRLEIEVREPSVTHRHRSTTSSPTTMMTDGRNTAWAIC